MWERGYRAEDLNQGSAIERRYKINPMLEVVVFNVINEFAEELLEKILENNNGNISIPVE